MLAIMDKNRKIIEEDIATLVFYMKGGITYDDAWLLTTDQRKTMARVIERHFEKMNGGQKELL
jgi:hypothetical protein